MITLSNFSLGGNTIDITIPQSSVVYFDKDFSITNKKPMYSGNILYKNFPILNAKKSFFKKIYTEITIGEMLSPKLSIIKNLQIFAKAFGVKTIWSLPLKYFEIPEDLWKIKAKNVPPLVQLQVETSLLLFCRKSVCFLRNLPTINDEFTQNKLKGIIFAKAEYGREIIMYSGACASYDNEIKIIL